MYPFIEEIIKSKYSIFCQIILMLGFEMAQITWTKYTKTEDAVDLKRD